MRKNLLICCFICIYFCVMLLAGSASATNNEINYTVYLLYTIMPCLLSSCATFTITPKSDSKHNLFINTLPISRTHIILEKYLITYSMLLAGYLITGLSCMINHIVNNYKLNSNSLFIIFMIAASMIMFINLEIPIIMKWGENIAAAILISTTCIVLLVLITIFVKYSTSIVLIHASEYIFSHKLLIASAYSLICVLTLYISCKCY